MKYLTAKEKIKVTEELLKAARKDDPQDTVIREALETYLTLLQENSEADDTKRIQVTEINDPAADYIVTILTTACNPEIELTSLEFEKAHGSVLVDFLPYSWNDNEFRFAMLPIENHRIIKEHADSPRWVAACIRLKNLADEIIRTTPEAIRLLPYFMQEEYC